MAHVCFNGSMILEETPVLKADNRGFKYGDGVFETIRMVNGSIPLFSLHFERLVTSLLILKISHTISGEQISQWIIELCTLNQCLHSGRVRLAVYRNNEGKAEILIEAQPLSNVIVEGQVPGISITTYPLARKSMDAFSNLKTANFLPYVMAGLYAVNEGFDDAIVLNSDNNICDSSKANVFVITKNEIFTPALHQGCVNGVMRRYLIDNLKKMNYAVHQQALKEEDLLQADEIFLSNAIYGIKSVRTFRNKEYPQQFTSGIYQNLVAPLFA